MCHTDSMFVMLECQLLQFQAPVEQEGYTEVQTLPKMYILITHVCF